MVMSKKAWLWILIVVLIQVIFGFIYTRCTQSAFHPIVAYAELVFGVIAGAWGSWYWNKYIKKS